VDGSGKKKSSTKSPDSQKLEEAQIAFKNLETEIQDGKRVGRFNVPIGELKTGGQNYFLIPTPRNQYSLLSALGLDPTALTEKDVEALRQVQASQASEKNPEGFSEGVHPSIQAVKNLSKAFQFNIRVCFSPMGAIGNVAKECQEFKGKENLKTFDHTLYFSSEGDHFDRLIPKTPRRVKELLKFSTARESVGTGAVPASQVQNPQIKSMVRDAAVLLLTGLLLGKQVEAVPPPKSLQVGQSETVPNKIHPVQKNETVLSAPSLRVGDSSTRGVDSQRRRVKDPAGSSVKAVGQKRTPLMGSH
ncbi:MAG: hypothetical protein ACO3A2_10200, partial [Bdellovibrionia bacterium]